MLKSIDLSGVWRFQLDKEKKGLRQPLSDTIYLPGTTSYYKKGEKNKKHEIAHLTEEYTFEGYAWYSREFEIPEEYLSKPCFLYLERTRKTTVWINNINKGSQNSLCTPHIYNITGSLHSGANTVTILIDNTDYPTKGGHMTSPDTQTNWNGITGKIELQIYNPVYLGDVQIYPDIHTKSVRIVSRIEGADGGVLKVSAEGIGKENKHCAPGKQFLLTNNNILIDYPLGEDALLWCEYHPNLYKLKLELMRDGFVVDNKEVIIGLREFKAKGDKFTINSRKIFLRGKHDGMIFPETGYAPTTVSEWIKVFKIAKSYGINHYRFHTCCPPEAAFTAADIVGIYMEPELPFWGTVTDEGDENHNKEEQEYIVNEGFLILKRFGNHPSFVMMSLGNELWGSKERLNQILKMYKEFDNRHLYTQGSNNFQFSPVILENDDFFCGVRFSKERHIRGSYAMCDAPLGHVQTDMPSTAKDYDDSILPPIQSQEIGVDSSKTIEVQYGMGIKKVSISPEDELIPKIPVVSHEIGQYSIFPNYAEIDKYKGPLKARNFEVFRKRLEEKGLLDLADKYFKCSGKLAVSCYKEELEAAFRTKKLAGFQILDIQDFNGQGTALVGILDSFMDSKGLITPEEWRTFCSDAVLLARFDRYNFIAGQDFSAHIELCYFRDIPLNTIDFSWTLKEGRKTLKSGCLNISDFKDDNYINIGSINFQMPDVSVMKELTLILRIDSLNVWKTYPLWVYPKNVVLETERVNIFDSISCEALRLLEKGQNILIVPRIDRLGNKVKGFYCTDFWCYPMFRSISENMNKPLPVGTMGLLINNSHPVFKYFPCKEYSTYQWWNIVSNSCSVIMDETADEFRPIIQTIDNFERNHKLGMLFECKVLNGKALVCSCDFNALVQYPEGKQFMFSIFKYVQSEEFRPEVFLSVSDLRRLLD